MVAASRRKEIAKSAIQLLSKKWGDSILDPRVTVRPSGLPSGRVKPREESLPLLPIAEAGAPVEDRDLQVLDVLGQGGMGVVVLARQSSLGREVAVKRLHEHMREDASQAESLRLEARYTGLLEHPNIVPVYQLGRDDDGAPVMVMKRVEGVRWFELIQDADNAFWDDVRGDRVDYHIRLAVHLCHALEYAHSRGVLHRDIKPDNVLIGSFGEIVLLDWGLAIEVADANGPRDAIAGTPAYMAPEMLGEELGSIDEHTDVYLLAASLHHAVTGAPPHSGASVAALMLSLMEAQAPQYDADVPPERAGICQRALAPDPADRFEDIAGFRVALEGFLEHRSSVALTNAAADELEQMQKEIEADEVDAARVRTLFDAARFGLEQALSVWPKNMRARELLTDAVARVLEQQIDTRHLETAKLFLARLRELDEGRARPLEVAVERLERELDAEDAEQKRLKRLDADLDPTVSARQRKLGLRALSILITLAAVSLMTFRLFGFGTPPKSVFFGVTLAIIAGLGLIVFVFRRFFFTNRANRVMTAVVAAFAGAVFLNRVHGLLAGHCVDMLVSGDGIVGGVVAALAAVVLRDRRFLVPAGLLSVFGLVGAVYPSFGFMCLGLSALLSVLFVTFTPPPDHTAQLP